jgi:hypothetical protein
VNAADIGTMAIRDRIRANASPLLQAGEEIQAVIPAQTVSAYYALISIWLIMLLDGHRVVVVTNRRIFLCSSGRISIARVRAVLAQLPRHTAIGPPRGLWYRTDALGERLYINRRFHKDVLAADGARGDVQPPLRQRRPSE